MIRIIFSVYIFYLACYPCSDIPVCMDEVKENVAMSGHDHDHSSGEQDLCSPFCICTCCSTQMNVPDYFRFQVIRFTFNDDKNSFFKAHVNNAVFATIWQPPKLNLS